MRQAAAQLRLFESPKAPATPKQIALQLSGDGLIVTLEKFHAEQMVGGKETVSLRTLQRQAESGELVGAYKQGNKWWVNKMARLLQTVQGLECSGEDGSGQETSGPPPPPRARNWRGGVDQATGRELQIPRPEEAEKPPPSPRYRS